MRLAGIKSAHSSFKRTAADEDEAARALFRQGASISDLMIMYEPAALGDWMRDGVKPLYIGQSRTLDIDSVISRLAPLQRPLIEPILEPFMIRDLANIVLDYF
jgi:hypothetical protein